MGLLVFAHPLPNTAAHVLTGIVAGAPHLPPWVRGLTALLFAVYQLLHAFCLISHLQCVFCDPGCVIEG